MSRRAPTVWRDWFAGFVDGEGCFVVERSNHPSGSIGYTPRFSIVLREDDKPTLEHIREMLGVGTITLMSNARRRRNGTSKGADCWQFRVHGRNCQRVVEALAGRLRTKKSYEFNVWREAVALRCRVSRCIGPNAIQMESFRTQLQAAKKLQEAA